MNHLPKELTNLVNKAVVLLGEVIKEEAGALLFKKIEKIRKDMIEYRDFSDSDKKKSLEKLYKYIDKEKSQDKHNIALGYTLMLELINCCEAAYRTYRLSSSRPNYRFDKQDNTMIYVLTAHPTEARTSENIELFGRIQSILVKILDKSAEEDYLKFIIKHNLKLAWLLPVTRHKKPAVVDEANHLFSIIFRPDIFNSILRSDRDLGEVRIRTWVGGDKDGHPGVDDVVMIDCLQASRKRFIKILESLIKDLETDISFINNKDLNEKIKVISKNLAKLVQIKSNDYLRVLAFKKSVNSFNDYYIKKIGMQAPRIKKLYSIFKLFPAMVIPIEIRESSDVIENALIAKKQFAITKMIKKIKTLTDNKDITNYVEGFIISNCESYQDVKNTMTLVKSIFSGLYIPIIPLFESAAALSNSPEIVNELLADKIYVKSIQKHWNNKLEVMLGYSDSSKGMGVLPSRIAIAKTMRSLDVLISKKSIIPVFFHGSGGSVDRGGGSILDQTAWWPKSALTTYKATIQGEMVERNFTSPEVVLSGVDKILQNFNNAKSKKGIIKIDQSVEEFAAIVKRKYEEEISGELFFEMVDKATPYSYLNVLKLGSRPSKRSTAKVLDFSSIRAIPWVLCWTQTRLLFPTWWGVGSAWKEFKYNNSLCEGIKKSYKESYIFATYIRTLGFTLSKVDLNVFHLYLSKSSLSKPLQKKFFEELETEFNLTLEFIKYLTGHDDLLWYRPWLSDSINLRSSMIHPLNVLQIQGNISNDTALVRRTVAGISSGMMTTG